MRSQGESGSDGGAATSIRRWAWSLLWVGLLLLVASAWLSDDAFITFRTVDNFLNGRGLTWNPAERVQAYTHPLWMLLQIAASTVTGEILITSLVLSMALSWLTVYLVLFRLTGRRLAGCLAAGALLLSRSWVDFATSGLEDPLARLLLVLFCLVQLRGATSARRLFLLSLLAALLAVCRPDAMLLVLPALSLASFRSLGTLGAARTGGAAALGLLPLAAWGAFSLFYYGTPFPNTAYAKLGLDLPRSELVRQGFVYLFDSFHRDPITLTLPVFALVLVLATDRRGGWTPTAAGVAAWTAGTWLYLAYVVWIGGDFMTGRLLGSPFLLSVVALAVSLDRDAIPLPASVAGLPPRSRLALTFALLALLLAIRVVGPMTERPVEATGIADERRFYYPHTGLLHAFGQRHWPDHPWRDEAAEAIDGGTTLLVRGSVGILGFYSGPRIHLVDPNGLADPLLSRLPADRTARSRPGHRPRALPHGYVEGLRVGRNGIAHPDLAAYYDVLHRITRGPLWDRERLGTVLRHQLGAYDHLLDAYLAEAYPPAASAAGAASPSVP